MPHKNPMLSPTKKGEIYGKFKSGRSMSKLAKEVGRSKSTIEGIIEKRERTGTVKPACNTGNAHILTPADENRMLRSVRKDQKQTSAQISGTVGVSASTVERAFKSKGCIRAACRRKPNLTFAQIKQRLDWAQANVNQDWTRGIFTDEAASEIGDDLKKESCWRKPHGQNLKANLSVRKRKGKMVNVWGAGMYGHKFPLVRLSFSQLGRGTRSGFRLRL